MFLLSFFLFAGSVAGPIKVEKWDAYRVTQEAPSIDAISFVPKGAQDGLAQAKTFTQTLAEKTQSFSPYTERDASFGEFTILEMCMIKAAQFVYHVAKSGTTEIYKVLVCDASNAQVRNRFITTLLKAYQRREELFKPVVATTAAELTLTVEAGLQATSSTTTGIVEVPPPTAATSATAAPAKKSTTTAASVSGASAPIPTPGKQPVAPPHSTPTEARSGAGATHKKTTSSAAAGRDLPTATQWHRRNGSADSDCSMATINAGGSLPIVPPTAQTPLIPKKKEANESNGDGGCPCSVQ